MIFSWKPLFRLVMQTSPLFVKTLDTVLHVQNVQTAMKAERELQGKIHQIEKTLEMQVHLNAQLVEQLELMKSTFESMRQSLRGLFFFTLITLILSGSAIFLLVLKS